jgi:sugar phosphate isomerase/epimerase
MVERHISRKGRITMTGNDERAPIALQLYSVRGEVSNDLPGALRGVAEIGYVAAEPWGFSGEEARWQGHSAVDIRRMYDDCGLACCGFHLATGALLGDNLERTIEFNQLLGNRYLIVAMDKERMSAGDSIMELADILNEVSERLEKLDMWTGYHAHGLDFERFGDETAWEILFSNTRQQVVMQIDVGNCADGGGDPVAMLEKFPGRSRSVHLKDYNAGPDGVIGQGDADWDRIFHLCDALHQPEWYVVEEGGADGFGFDVSRRSLEALKAMGR